MPKAKTSKNNLETRLKSALKGKNRELALLHQISETISCNLNLDDVLKQIIGIVVNQTRADACLLYLIDEKKDELVLTASMNPHPKLIGRVRLELGEGITGWVAKERRPVMIARNAGDDPRFRMFHNLPEDRYQALFSVPVVTKDQVIGVINIQHKKPRRYSESETDLLMMIGQQVGGAIENARLVDELKKQAGRIETLSRVSQTIASNRYLKEILQLIVTMTAGMMNSTICSMMLLDEEKQELEIVATQSLSEAYRRKPNLKVGESISGQAVQKKKADFSIGCHHGGRLYLFRPGAKRRSPLPSLDSHDDPRSGGWCGEQLHFDRTFI